MPADARAALAIAILVLAGCRGDADGAPVVAETSPSPQRAAPPAPDPAAVDPSAGDPPAPAAPASTWPAGLPWIPGGTLLPARHAGAIHVARARWPVGAEALETLLRGELEERGWEVGPAPEEEVGIRRLVARREQREIAMSIYADDESAEERGTVVQTMELRLE